MAFDITTAKPVEPETPKTSFDLNTAMPAEPNPTPAGEMTTFGAFKKYPKSYGNLFKNFANVVLHPIKSASAVMKTIDGALYSMDPEEYISQSQQAGQDPIKAKQEGEQNKQYFTALKKDIENKGIYPFDAQKVLEYAYNDPAQFSLDLSVLLGGVGAGVSKTAAIAKLPALAKTAEIIGKTAEVVNPLSIPLKATGKAVELTGKVVEKVSSPFAQSVNTPVLESAQKLNIPLPASAITKSPGARTIETVAGKGLFGNKIGQKIEQAYIKLNQIADETVNKIGQTKDLSVAGRNIASGFEKYKNTYDEIKIQLYNDFANQGGLNVPAVTDETVQTLKNILQQKREAFGAESVDVKYFDTILQDLQKYPNPQYRNLKATRTIIGQKLKSTDPIVTGNRADFKNIYRALAEDIDNTIINNKPELQPVIEKANEFYKDGLFKLNSEYGTTIQKLADAQQYDKIITEIMNPRISSDDIPRIFEVIGEENKAQMQSSLLEDIIKKSKNTDGNFLPNGIARQITKYGEDKLSKIFTPEQLTTLKDISNVSKGLGKVGKLAEGSQTAFLSRIMFEIGATFSHPLLAGKVLFGDALFSKFISSEMGQKWLTTGLKTEVNIGKGIQRVGQGIYNAPEFLVLKK